MHNCKFKEIVLSLAIIIFVFVDVSWAKWVILVAAVLLLLHSFGCKSCCSKDMKTKKPMKKKK